MVNLTLYFAGGNAYRRCNESLEWDGENINCTGIVKINIKRTKARYLISNHKNDLNNVTDI